MKPIATILFIVASATVEVAMARMPGPPPEAVEACATQSTGAQCSFSSRGGDTVTGQCSETPKGEMACMPEGGPPEGEGRPGGQRPPRSE